MDSLNILNRLRMVSILSSSRPCLQTQKKTNQPLSRLVNGSLLSSNNCNQGDFSLLPGVSVEHGEESKKTNARYKKQVTQGYLSTKDQKRMDANSNLKDLSGSSITSLRFKTRLSISSSEPVMKRINSGLMPACKYLETYQN